jgi:hypothetical protein
VPEDNIVDFSAAKRSQKGQQASTYEALSRLDDLETLLEAMDEAGVSTRDELVALITRLEAELDPDRT